MAFKHLLLGLLTHKAASGYDLAKAFFEPTRPSLPHVYRSLSSMLEEGLVARKKDRARSGFGRNVYSITTAGRSELQNWLTKMEDTAPIRQPILAKLWFGDLQNNKTLVSALKKFKKKREKELDYYNDRVEQIITLEAEIYGDQIAKPFWGVVVDYVRHRAQLDIDWAQRTIKYISSLSRQ